MPEQNTTDLTENLPTLSDKTRSRLKHGAIILTGVVAAGLVVDSQIKKFKARKSVIVKVKDQPDN